MSYQVYIAADQVGAPLKNGCDLALYVVGYSRDWKKGPGIVFLEQAVLAKSDASFWQRTNLFWLKCATGPNGAIIRQSIASQVTYDVIHVKAPRGGDYQ